MQKGGTLVKKQNGPYCYAYAITRVLLKLMKKLDVIEYNDINFQNHLNKLYEVEYNFIKENIDSPQVKKFINGDTAEFDKLNTKLINKIKDDKSEIEQKYTEINKKLRIKKKDIINTHNDIEKNKREIIENDKNIEINKYNLQLNSFIGNKTRLSKTQDELQITYNTLNDSKIKLEEEITSLDTEIKEIMKKPMYKELESLNTIKLSEKLNANLINILTDSKTKISNDTDENTEFNQILYEHDLIFERLTLIIIKLYSKCDEIENADRISTDITNFINELFKYTDPEIETIKKELGKKNEYQSVKTFLNKKENLIIYNFFKNIIDNRHDFLAINFNLIISLLYKVSKKINENNQILTIKTKINTKQEIINILENGFYIFLSIRSYFFEEDGKDEPHLTVITHYKNDFITIKNSWGTNDDVIGKKIINIDYFLDKSLNIYLKDAFMYSFSLSDIPNLTATNATDNTPPTNIPITNVATPTTDNLPHTNNITTSTGGNKNKTKKNKKNKTKKKYQKRKQTRKRK